MLYYLFDLLNLKFAPPGFNLFKYLSFRSALAALTSLFLAFYLGPKIIAFLKRKQIGEEIKAIGPQNHFSKKGTPTMGGMIIIASVVVPVLLWGDIKNANIILVLFGTIALSAVGFLDDYLKVVKKFPNGLIGRYKIMGQVFVGGVIGVAIYFFPEIFFKTFSQVNTLSTVPFLKGYNFDLGFLYIPFVIFVVTATSNAVNLTDGLDGLAIGLFIIAMFALAIAAYVTGNSIYADYLNIVYLPGSGELTIFIAALIGAGLGFLWYNFYPAQVFMGDTGSLALGGALGIISILIKKEFIIPIVGGVFFFETLSVIIQSLYFKYTRKRTGEGKRVFRMAPIHHHFELGGWPEPKVVIRFYIIGIILAIISLATYKIR